MQTYKQYRPTGFDTAGLNLSDRQDWFVLPIGHNRDTLPGSLQASNWHSVLTHLGGESETLEVHSFGHWACGWFEIALLAPSRKAEGEAVESALDSYPVFDESDWSERESEATAEDWEQYGSEEYREWLVASGVMPEDMVEDLDGNALYEKFCSSGSETEYYESEGTHFRFAI